MKQCVFIEHDRPTSTRNTRPNGKSQQKRHGARRQAASARTKLNYKRIEKIVQKVVARMAKLTRFKRSEETERKEATQRRRLEKR